MALAMGLILVSLFVIVTRKKALTQVVGFLMLENGIALLAILGTYGIRSSSSWACSSIAAGFHRDADLHISHPRNV